jgi:hypothetical protein
MYLLVLALLLLGSSAHAQVLREDMPPVVALYADPSGCPSHQLVLLTNAKLQVGCVNRIQGTAVAIGSSNTSCPAGVSFCLHTYGDASGSPVDCTIDKMVSPGTLRGFSASVQTAPGLAGSNKRWTVSLIVGAGVVGTCQIIETATECSIAATPTAAAGDRIYVTFTGVNSPANCNGARWVGQYDML